MKLGIADMEASLVPREGNQMGMPDHEWDGFSREGRLERVMEVIGGSSFDFVDLGVGWINDSPTAVSPELVGRVTAEKEVRVGSYTSFLPADLRVVGEGVDVERLGGYLRDTLARCHQLGGRVIGFGSGPSREIPKGYSLDRARRDLLGFLERVVSIIEENDYDLVIAIESLDPSECNFINTLEEAHELCVMAANPRIGLLLDLYHVGRQKNDYWTEVEKTAEHIMHVQLAEPTTRRQPGYLLGATAFDYKRLFEVLKRYAYEGDISVECIFHDLPQELEACHSFLKGLL